MGKKTIKQKLSDKLKSEHQITIDPDKMISFRRCGFGVRIVSWGVIGGNFESFNTMKECLKYPTILIKHSDTPIIRIEVSLDKMAEYLKKSI